MAKLYLNHHQKLCVYLSETEKAHLNRICLNNSLFFLSRFYAFLNFCKRKCMLWMNAIYFTSRSIFWPFFEILKCKQKYFIFFCNKLIHSKNIACFSPVIWVSISPCICNESTKMLRLPMKRAQAIPLYGWQNPSSSKSSLRHERESVDEWKLIYRYLNSINTYSYVYNICATGRARHLLQTELQMPKHAAIHINSTRGQSMFEYCTKPTSCSSVEGKGFFLLLFLNRRSLPLLG